MQNAALLRFVSSFSLVFVENVSGNHMAIRNGQNEFCVFLSLSIIDSTAILDLLHTLLSQYYSPFISACYGCSLVQLHFRLYGELKNNVLRWHTRVHHLCLA